MNHAEFLAADSRRAFSPEWDYGVMWRNGERWWPQWRVSWVVETGELYAVELVGDQRVEILGVVPREGEYPHSARADSWTDWKNEQPIERVMEGGLTSRATSPGCASGWPRLALSKGEVERERVEGMPRRDLSPFESGRRVAGMSERLRHDRRGGDF